MAGRDNIFAIDFDAVVQTIKDANDDLSNRHNELLAACNRMPTTLQSNDEIRKAKKFAEQLKQHQSACRSTRLGDTKPLRALVKRVEKFFKEMEDDAKTMQDTVINKLSEKALSTSFSSQENREDHLGSKSFLVDSRSGEILGSAALATSDRSSEPEDILTSWEIDTINRETIDLDALRDYLSDSAILNAARKHLKANGPMKLRGASYKQVAVL